ncbi:hypothetical protein Hypma_011413 [Hypsizygus marmoreus]|uniref:Arrestin-like N-terminal domain-containing protein n=1 Tax=Hypsizygus marmoreus TaxID=39966 RepID=A0A369JLA2_HYPMA|nr:hypothetical protein Hypma_011413 [Hypsizygus marmoreus]
MFMDDQSPPSYDFDVCLPSPVYSSNVGSMERFLLSERPRSTGCPGCDWMAETKHMKINLGFRIWGLDAPSYGLNGKAEGSVQFSGDQDRVERVNVTLSGNIITAASSRGAFLGESVVPILSTTVELYNSAKRDLLAWDQDRCFSILLPPTVNINGRSMPTPPSFFSIYQHVSCEVSYALKFQMARKGPGLNKIETKVIQILYLPKSSPFEPPLTAIPRLPRRTESRASLLALFQRVKTVALSPFYPPFSRVKRPNTDLLAFTKTVHLSLPTPHCFTSGEPIPFTLSLVFPNNPVLASLHLDNTQIHLLRRLVISRKGIDPIYRDTCVSSAHLCTSKEYSEGTRLLRGTLQAGIAGGESSWVIDDLAGIQYVICAILRPPDNLLKHIPSFRHEEIVQITTDHWGTLDRELSSVWGTPTPALGLARSIMM